ncbi:MAG: hypothetical protein GX790_08555 [Syntrophomonadaceae bacterium]|nr:hypothetical protein [Syntrophomonadaceae bacterium]
MNGAISNIDGEKTQAISFSLSFIWYTYMDWALILAGEGGRRYKSILLV